MLSKSVEGTPSEEMASGRGRTIHLIDGSVGAKHIDVHVNELNPGMGPGVVHYHTAAENVYYVLDGEGKVTHSGGELTVRQGDIVFIPPREVHSLTNVGTGTLRLIEIYRSEERRVGKECRS